MHVHTEREIASVYGSIPYKNNANILLNIILKDSLPKFSPKHGRDFDSMNNVVSPLCSSDDLNCEVFRGAKQRFIGVRSKAATQQCIMDDMSVTA